MTKTATPTVPAAPAAATTTVAGVTREAPIMSAVRLDIPMPERSSNRGSKSAYNFDGLTAVGASLGITNKTREQVNAIVNRENRKHCTETVDPTNPAKKIKTYSKRFEAFDVDAATDPDKAKVRIFRVE